MNSKHFLTLAVRVAGLVGMMYLIRHWGAYWHRHNELFGKHRWEMIFEVILFVIGIFMAIGFPPLMRFFVPKDEDDKDSSHH